MSLSDIDMIMQRIKAAPPESPIDVYMQTLEGEAGELNRGMRKLDAVFASTFAGHHRPRVQMRNYIGRFHRDNKDMEEVRMVLRIAAKEY